MDKKGRGMKLKLNATIVLLLVVGGLMVYSVFFKEKHPAPQYSVLQGVEQGQASLSGCPTDGDTSFTIGVQNVLNQTGTETFDMTYYMTGSNGDYQTGTDTGADGSAGTETLNCGETYTMNFIRGNSDAGDNSRVKSVLQGAGARVNSDGSISFTPTVSNYYLIAGATQHGALEFRAYDNNNAGFMCDSEAAGTCTDWEIDGISFESTTNGTALAIGAGGDLDITIQARANQTDTDFDDQYVLILVEAPVATWNEPVVKVDGVRLTDVKGSLTPYEENAFAGYEFIYKFDKPVTDSGIDVDVYMKALAGVNPSTHPEVDFASAGRYLSIDGVTTKVGAATDAVGNAATFDVQDVTINIS